MRGSRSRTHRRKRYPLRRSFYLAALLACLGLGLASRAYAAALPPWLAESAGDALWASMVYFGIRLLLPGRRALLGALLALAFSFAIEFSQLYRAGWLDSLRAQRLGALVLGRGFLPADLLRYAAGVLCALAIDIAVVAAVKRGRKARRRRTRAR
ncbi:DUF2809 domain-containing protein [Saccharibacillus sp. CPCC 101409]|uniref:ribosomal maturation YjgA family protein n=1 Tax=Saccharibacillus sp. CPCC 101409 TaxID=3058041 RepID=UPI0026733429|nr:DUF2809 domain-containing protein [Saccharibacillus sp. CPCC 101409]MDO3410851.1 DUF2809 domain-containing protein [Saccharibacillus sp. CPCC 101409]